MQIVIELSDETYKDIKEENGIYGINNGLSARITGKVVGAIQNGISLDKIRAEISCNIVEDDISGNTPAKLRADWAAANKAHMIDIAILDKYRAGAEEDFTDECKRLDGNCRRCTHKYHCCSSEYNGRH